MEKDVTNDWDFSAPGAADEAPVVVLLTGIAAYLLHNGSKAVGALTREVSSGKLGEKFGDWLSRNAEKLKTREDLGGVKRGGGIGQLELK